MKECNICRKVKELSEYYAVEKYSKTKGSYTYYYPYCVTCTKEKSSKHQMENYEKHLERCRKSQSRPEYKKKFKKYNRDAEERGDRKEWRRKNPDKLKGYVKDREMNKKHIISKQEWRSCKDYFNNLCAYCGLNFNEHYRKWNGELKKIDFHREHVDHEGVNDLSNCVPSCQSCNSSKRNKEFSEWYCEDNEVYTPERLFKIISWLDDDYKCYMNIDLND